jgi:MFS family permease
MRIASADERRILFARGLRDFGDGFAAVLLPAYVAALGYGAVEIGLVATVALFGSALTTMGVGLVGARVGNGRLLVLASLLMAATGVVFAFSSGFAALLAIAFLGTINPSAGTVSVFSPLEQTALARVAADEHRTSIFGRYSLVGALAAAVGALAAGSAEAMAKLGLTELDALRAMFLLYAALGLGCAAVYARLAPEPPRAPDAPAAALGPSRAIVVRLAALFSVDSFAGGFAVQSLLALWLFERFGLSLAMAGAFFFWSGVLAAFSFPVAVWLSRRIGLVNTMVWTHVPSSLCLIGAALVPQLELALGLLLLRSALSQMDVPTRSSYVMAVVTPAERPAAASFTAVPRSLAAAASPALAGALYAAGYQAWPFILCGVLKIAYDFALLWAFRHLRPPEER